MTDTDSLNIKNNLRPARWRLRPNERRVLLVFGDFAVAVLALAIALIVWAQDPKEWLNFSYIFLRERPPFWFYLLPFGWVILMIQLYDVRRAARRQETVVGVFFAAAISLVVYVLVFFFLSAPDLPLPRRGVAVFIGVTALLTILWRLLYIRIFTAPQFMRRVLIVGAGRAGSTLVRVTRALWPLPFFLVGFIDDDPEKIGTEIEGVKVLGGGDRLLEILQREMVTDLIFAITGDMQTQTFQSILTAGERGVDVTTMPIVYEELLGRVPIFLLHSDWILRSFVDQVHAGGLYAMSKRLLDLVGGLVGMLMLALVFPFIALSIIIDDGFPIFYRQIRLGKNGQPYNIVKFRTMRRDAEKDGKARMATENDDRATRVGRFLRKSHLDELPQFVSVVIGDMSLVGPRAERPELVDHLQKKVPFYRARLFVKPGLTGWAQVNFGYASTVEDTAVKLEYDLYYIKHRNLALDLTTLVRTIGTVVGLRGQ